MENKSSNYLLLQTFYGDSIYVPLGTAGNAGGNRVAVTSTVKRGPGVTILTLQMVVALDGAIAVENVVSLRIFTLINSLVHSN